MSEIVDLHAQACRGGRVIRPSIYIFPALMDVLLGSFFFVGTVRLAESGASATAVSGVITVWGVTYMLTTPLVGRMVSGANCVRMMLGACCGMAVCAIGFVLFPQTVLLYVGMGVYGVAMAFFFPPFMVFMKAFEEGRSRGLAYSVSSYTLSWSLGLAAGPYVAAYLWTAFGWQWCYILDVVLALATGAGILMVSRQGLNRETRPFASGPTGIPDYSVMPDLACVAWVGAGITLVAIAAVRAVFPSSAAALSISKPDQGTTLALLCLAQAAVAVLLRRSRRWMYRPIPVAAFGCVGVAGLVLFGFARTPAGFFAAALCLGVYGGGVFIYMAFHALVHPSRAARYAGINESVVGFSGIAGPAAGGLIADYAGLQAPYFAFAALGVAAIVLQVVVHGSSAASVKRLG